MNPIHRRNTLKNPDPNFFFCPCSNGVLSPSIARTISSSVSCGLASSSSSSWPTERVREADSPSSAEDGGSGCPKSSMCRRRCRNFHAMHMRRSMACMIPETANMIQPEMQGRLQTQRILLHDCNSLVQSVPGLSSKSASNINWQPIEVHTS